MFQLNEDTKTISNEYTSDRLAPMEFKLLKYLLENKGKVISRDKLIEISGAKNKRSMYSVLWVLIRKKRVKIPIVIIPKGGIVLLDKLDGD